MRRYQTAVEISKSCPDCSGCRAPGRAGSKRPDLQAAVLVPGGVYCGGSEEERL